MKNMMMRKIYLNFFFLFELKRKSLKYLVKLINCLHVTTHSRISYFYFIWFTTAEEEEARKKTLVCCCYSWKIFHGFSAFCDANKDEYFWGYVNGVTQSTENSFFIISLANNQKKIRKIRGRKKNMKIFDIRR